MSQQKPDVRSYKTWPPGSQIVYHYVIDRMSVTIGGLVVANTRDEIMVMWHGNGHEQFKTYLIATMNDRTVYTQEQFRLGCKCCKRIATWY